MKTALTVLFIFSLIFTAGCETQPLINTFVANHRPTDLKIDGPKKGYVGIIYEFSVSAVDLNGDVLQYGIDWNNDNYVEGYTSPAPGGQWVTIKNSWSKPGVYYFSVVALDSYHAMSSKVTHKIEVYPPER